MTNASIPQKRCRICGQSYPATKEYFHACKSIKDGLRNECKSCCAAYARGYRRDPEKVARIHEQQKKYRAQPHAKRLHMERGKRSRRRNPNKWRARYAVNDSIRRGDIPSALTLKCAHCGKPAHGYHHYMGYAREHWLTVIPLCFDCHLKADGREKLAP